MLIPQDLKLSGYQGGTFIQALNFWQDDAHTVPFDFTPWTVEIDSAGLPSGAPLPFSFAISGGTLTLALTPAETAAATAASYHVIIKLIATSGSPPEVEFLAHGPATFAAP